MLTQFLSCARACIKFALWVSLAHVMQATSKNIWIPDLDENGVWNWHQNDGIRQAKRVYGWQEYTGLWHDQDRNEKGFFSELNTAESTKSALKQTSARLGKPLAADSLGGSPVYISLTSIHNRLYGVTATIDSIITGHVLPSHIYLFLSQDPFLLDQGVSPDFLHSDTMRDLRAVYRRFPHISIVFVDNMGPHRKLLPLLAAKWTEDCVIVTVDDHLLYPPSMLASLLEYDRAAAATSVVARRARRMGLCSSSPPWMLAPYTRNRRGLWPETKPARQEMLMLPTGTGGVLYRPWYFHPVVFDADLRNATITGDDLLFRLATLAKGVPVVTSCSIDDTKYTCPTSEGIRATVAAQWPPASPQQLSRNWNEKSFTHQVQSVPPALVGGSSVDHAMRQGESNTAAPRKRKRKDRGVRRQQPKNDDEDAGGRLRWLASSKMETLPQFKRTADAESPVLARRLKQVVNAQDERKQISLATVFNNRGGNTAMWDAATQYLQRLGVLDFPQLLQKVAAKERDSCLLSRAVVRPGAGQGLLGLAHVWDAAVVGVQNVYDAECGITAC